MQNEVRGKEPEPIKAILVCEGRGMDLCGKKASRVEHSIRVTSM